MTKERKAPTGFIGRSTKGPGSAEYSALDTTWQTPEWVLDKIRLYYGGPIPFDVATAPDNPTKAIGFWTAVDDALPRDWPEQSYCNPPYGKALRAWYPKFHEESQRGIEIIAVLPCARFEQAYFTNPFVAAKHVCLIRGRVSFIRAATQEEVGGNPYATMLVDWNTTSSKWREAFVDLGACFKLRKLCESPMNTARPHKNSGPKKKNLWGELE